ncbi:MAG: hypothetical protein WBA89_03255 [Microcoleus sp.]|uniref:hypothetical protein n=1 Tax=Microcoleus sp. TaxID=44472 RepID=UPI003C72FD77
MPKKAQALTEAVGDVIFLKKPGFSPPGATPGKISRNAATKVKCTGSYLQRKSGLALDSARSVEAGNTEATGCDGLGAVTPTKTNETAIKTPYKLTDSWRFFIPTH